MTVWRLRLLEHCGDRSTSKSAKSPTSSWIYGRKAKGAAGQGRWSFRLADAHGHGNMRSYVPSHAITGHPRSNFSCDVRVLCCQGGNGWKRRGSLLALIGRPMPTDENEAMNRERWRAIYVSSVPAAYTTCTKLWCSVSNIPTFFHNTLCADLYNIRTNRLRPIWRISDTGLW